MNTPTLSTEPVGIAAGVIVAAQALLVMAVSLNWISLDDTQQAAVTGAITAVVTLAVAVWARRRTTPYDPQHDA